MTKRALTDREVRALATERDQEDVRVGGIAGLLVRVSRTGRKTFMYVYEAPSPKSSSAKRRQRKIKIGLYPIVSLADARSIAKGYMGDLARGIDPGPTRGLVASMDLHSRTAPGCERLQRILGGIVPVPGNFAHLAAEYLVHHAWVNKKRTRDDESVLRRDILPAWGGLPAAEIRARDVVLLIDRITIRGAPIAARNTKMLISKIFNFGISRDLIERNPAIGVATPPPQSRAIWLGNREIQILWRELDRRQPITGSIFRAILLTGQRPGEICSMEWKEIQGSWWDLPAEKTKNGQGQRVFLGRQMQALLASLQSRTDGSPFVFQSPRKAFQPMRHINKVGRSICAATGLSFTPHDLRRTAATHLGEMGFSDEVIDAVLNHKRRGLVKIYNRYGYDLEKQTALTAWDEKIWKLVGSI